MSNLETKKTYGLFVAPINKKLISEFAKNGYSVLLFPSITAKKNEISEEMKRVLMNLTDFDWLIFTDVFSAGFFIEALRELGVDLFELDAFTICALGEAVSDRLRFEQIHADVIPTKIENDAVFLAISEFAADSLENLRFLVLKETSASFLFVEKLKQTPAIVEELAIYEGKFDIETANIKLKTLLKGGAVDEFIFSSAEDLISLKILFPDTDLALLFDETKVSAISETVYQTLLENALRPLYYHQK